MIEMVDLGVIATLLGKIGWDERARRNGRHATSPAIVQRLDNIDKLLESAKKDRGKIWDKLGGVAEQCARIEGRLEGGG